MPRNCPSKIVKRCSVTERKGKQGKTTDRRRKRFPDPAFTSGALPNGSRVVYEVAELGKKNEGKHFV